MGLEVAPFVQDLVVTNPISGDDVNQGDDHIRLLKATLKTTLPTATKAMYASAVSAKTASFTVVAADENKTFTVDTTLGAVVATLPTLASGDHGWMCFFIKMDSTNTFHVVPASGNVTSGPYTVAKARRCIPGVRFAAAWSGSSWMVERCERAPVGVVLEFSGASLPAGYEWPTGQTLASASTNYAEYNAAIGSGVTPDKRGRAGFGKTNMGGSDNGLLPSVPGTTLWATGGAETLTLAQANVPSYNLSIGSLTFSGSSSGTLTTSYLSASGGQAYTHGHPGSTVALGITGSSTSPAIAVNAGTTGPTGLSIADASHDHYHYFAFTPAGTIGGTLASGGSGTAFNKLPPAIIMNFILVVE